MLTTTNYGLKKPELTDNVKISDFNENADIIDAQLKTQADALAGHQAEDATVTTRGHIQLSDNSLGDSSVTVPTVKAVRKAVEQGSYSIARSGKDTNGIFLVVIHLRKSDGTKAISSVLSGGTTPQYTTRTVTCYGLDGITVEKTDAFTLSYDSDGDFTNEV